MSKIGRNDPCPCESGKKYKQCCLKAETERADEARKAPDHGVQRVIEWLQKKHPDQLREALHDGFFGGLEEEDWLELQALGDEIFNAIMINAMEWVLAEGLCEYRGEDVLIGDLILGRGGPLLTVEQRAWFEGLMATRMSLYEVGEIQKGEGFTLRDLLHPDREKLFVTERTTSLNTQPLDVFAARIVLDGNSPVLSGGVYPFRRLDALDLIDFIQEEMEQCEANGFDPDALISQMVIEAWLDAFFNPAPMPKMVDQTTGEEILFISDHYRVSDWKKLEKRFGEHAEIEGDRGRGWTRVFTGEDGRIRRLLDIEAWKEPDRLQVNYHTQSYADEGKVWVEALAGEWMTFIAREISDPEGLMKARVDSRPAIEKDDGEMPPISPKALSDLIEERLHEVYRDWEKKPVPILGDLTPREAIKTKKGMEKVKNLIRTYEHGEAGQARAQNRPVISYDFLWDRLGISKMP